MIRGSVVIAVFAVVVSLLLHAMGLGLTASRLTEQPSGTGPTDTVELGTSFEDLVETATKPVEPEVAEPPEPTVEEEPQPAPEPAEIPTSEVHVASDDPKRTFAPDTGETETVQPVAPEPVEPEAVETPDTTDGEAEASDELDETPSVEPAATAAAPEGDPEVTTPAEAEPVTPEELQAEAPAPAEVLVPSVDVPDPVESETVEADIPVTPSEPASDAEENRETSELAVTSSIRPQLPDRRPTPTPQGVLNGSRDFSALSFPSRQIESPLTTYRRRGVDVFTSGDSGSRSGGRGPGNSDRTNYAGRVLVHLNRTPAVYTAARGFARVFFMINPDGTLNYVEVVDTNGSPDLERAAKAQVQAAAPFPKPPGGVSRSLSFVYSSN